MKRAGQRDRAALLGNGEMDDPGYSSRQTDSGVLEQQNDALVDELGAKVALLKSLTINIGEEVKEQHGILDGMNLDFSSAGGLLGSTMRRLQDMSRAGHTRIMWYMVAFVFFSFFILYFFLRS